METTCLSVHWPYLVLDRKIGNWLAETLLFWSCCFNAEVARNSSPWHLLVYVCRVQTFVFVTWAVQMSFYQFGLGTGVVFIPGKVMPVFVLEQKYFRIGEEVGQLASTLGVCT